MEIRNILTFLKAAELLNFSQTAKALGYSQSNITMQMKQLESELGCVLFDRVGKQISLTSEGMAFYPYARTIADTADTAVKAMSEQDVPQGELRIGILESLCISYMPELIQTLHKAHPLIHTIIKIGTFEELSQAINRNEIDLMWVFDQSLPHPEWHLAVESPCDIKVIAAPNQTSPPVNLAGLKDQNLILTEQGCSYRSIFEHTLLSAGIPFHIFMEIGNTEIIKKFVASGLCYSVLPAFSLEKELADQSLCCLNLADFHLTMYSQIFYHKDKWVSPAMKEFLRFAGLLLGT